jgi:hypothetical protein
VELSNEDLEDLRRAKRLLGHSNLAAKFADALKTPIDKLTRRIPRAARDSVLIAANAALKVAARLAIKSLRLRVARGNRLHKWAATVTGAAGGVFGLPGLLIELPATTTIMLRSIAEIAEQEGEELNSPEAVLACVEVFALSGLGDERDGIESEYFAMRAVLAAALQDAAESVAGKAGARNVAPALLRFLNQVAARFSIPVSEKLLVESIPVVGAVTGATVNALFIQHFQNLALGHFIVRRLERKYGAEVIRRVYSTLDVEQPVVRNRDRQV